MEPRPDITEALLAYERTWRDLFEETEDDEGVKSFVSLHTLRDGAYALLRHARALEDYFAGRWEPAEPGPPDIDEIDPDYKLCRIFTVESMKVDYWLMKKLKPLGRTPPPCSVESVEGARLFWRIGLRINPVAVAARDAEREALLDDFERLHTLFRDRLERLAAAFVYPMPALPASSALPCAVIESGQAAVTEATDAPPLEESARVSEGAGGKGKDRRIKGVVWYELTDDRARIKQAAIACGKKVGGITFDDRAIHRAAEQLFIRAAADGSFTRRDVRDILDEFNMSDASQDKVRDALDYQICRAIGATGKGRDKPKAFTLADKLYTTDLTFTCLNGLSDAERRDQQHALKDFAGSVGQDDGDGRGFHALSDDLD